MEVPNGRRLSGSMVGRQLGAERVAGVSCRWNTEEDPAAQWCGEGDRDWVCEPWWGMCCDGRDPIIFSESRRRPRLIESANVW